MQALLLLFFTLTLTPPLVCKGWNAKRLQLQHFALTCSGLQSM
jgi:hypothetical protein